MNITRAPISTPLREKYLSYIQTLNAQSYSSLPDFVSESVIHNSRPLGISGYIQLIKDSFSTYPWLHFNVGLLVVDEVAQTVASRLILKGHDPDATGVPQEHVFYQFRDGKIEEVWSVLDGF